jgi:energy-coupling factor transport system permease protein
MKMTAQEQAPSTMPIPDRSAIHAAAWGMWLAAIVAALAVTRNPLYLLFVLSWISLVTLSVNRLAAIAPQHQLGLPPVRISPITFGLFVVTISGVFNALNVHVGQTVLFRLPRGWPLIGGPITLEAFVYGALNGLALSGLFAAFVLLNRVVPIRSLVRLAPRAFYPVAVVVTIAVTFVPSTVRQFESIREAQAIRGHRIRGLRSWLPLIMPLLIGGLERALQLAEAMVARGFAGNDTPVDSYSRLAVALGMAALLAGMLFYLVWGNIVWGLGLLLLGTGAVAWAVARLGQGQHHTVYRPAPWRMRDTLVCAGALITTVAFLVPLPGIDRNSALYYPYPALSWPALDVPLGMATWGLLPPAFVLLRALALNRG